MLFSPLLFPSLGSFFLCNLYCWQRFSVVWVHQLGDFWDTAYFKLHLLHSPLLVILMLYLPILASYQQNCSSFQAVVFICHLNICLQIDLDKMSSIHFPLYKRCFCLYPESILGQEGQTISELHLNFKTAFSLALQVVRATNKKRQKLIEVKEELIRYVLIY